MLRRIIALIIILPIGLIVLAIAGPVMASFGSVSVFSGYGPGPFQPYGSPAIIGAPSGGNLLLVAAVYLGLMVLLVWFLARLVQRRPPIAGYGRNRVNDDYGRGDTELIQQLHHIASRLEARIEALETIMLERPGVTTKR